jgi:RNA polymerase sigma-70 factor (ECF subfamily)
MSDPWVTRQTLIMRAKDQGDQDAWEDFVAYYEGFISLVLAKMGMRYEIIDDLKQNILVKIWKGLHHFEPDSDRAKFRTWLNALIRNTTFTYLKSNKKHGKSVSIDDEDSSLMDELENQGPNKIDEMIETEWAAYISNKAMDNIAPLFSERAIEVFHMIVDGKSIEEVSKIVGIKENSVYKLKNRVKSRLMEEVQQLLSEFEPGKF